MDSNMTVKEILYSLVSVQSDTFTEKELDMSAHIIDMIRHQEYWKVHPELCGEYDGNDVIGRKVVWALRRGKTSKTVILTGHYDAVEIESYGTLKPLALKPDALREELKKMEFNQDVKADLESGEWGFGRAMADMKGGVACNLYTLFSRINDDVNVLYTGIPDEEHQAEGIMQSVPLMLELKKKYDLDYQVLVLTEPHTRKDPKKYMMYDGSIGKILPCIVARGKLCHVGNLMTGLNGGLMLSNIINRLELNCDFSCSEFNVKTPPPTVLYMKDSKSGYNVSIPEYSVAYINMFMTKNVTVPQTFERLKKVCEEGAREAVAIYSKAFQDMFHTQEGNPNFCVRVYTYEELDLICKNTVEDYEEMKCELLQRVSEETMNGSITVQDGGIRIIEKAIEWSKITEPVIVIGLFPPYVPAVNNHYVAGYQREKIVGAIKSILKEKYEMELDEDAYFMGLSDNSYVSCTQIENDLQAMSNMVTPKAVYHINFEQIGELAVPSIIVGPWGKDYHTMTERVYMPDVERVTPDILASIIQNI